MNRFTLGLILIVIFASCSNTPELETGEIKTLEIINQAFQKSGQRKLFIDSRQLLNRKKIDKAKIPVLFVELPSDQNGTLTLYPGQGDGQTWLGADGATITLWRGVLKASRGMGNDLMGSTSSMPPWSKIKNKTQIYNRELIYLTGNNKIFKRSFKCEIQRVGEKEIIKVWDVNFKVIKFEENCSNSSFKFKNTYFLDTKNIVRRSLQHHSNTIGSIVIERVDR